MGIQWTTVIIAAILGAFFGPWLLVKFPGRQATGTYQ